MKIFFSSEVYHYKKLIIKKINKKSTYLFIKSKLENKNFLSEDNSPINSILKQR